MTDTSNAKSHPTINQDLPCPFCGNVDLTPEDAGYNGIGWIKCRQCGCCGPDVQNPDGHKKGFCRMEYPLAHNMKVFKRAPAFTKLRMGQWGYLKLDGTPQPKFCCPLCGFTGYLDDHQIAADGTVTPSVVCDGRGCEFHAFIKLDHFGPAPTTPSRE